MTEFKSVSDMLEESSYTDQKAVRDEVADMIFRLRRTMDAGLTPDEMKVVAGEKAAAEAADEILAQIFS